MKKMKKFLAMLLAMAMVMGLSLTTFAEGDPKITVSNIDGEKPVTLTYLQIIEPDPTSETGWKFINDNIAKAYVDGYNEGLNPKPEEALEAQDVIQALIEARGTDGYANSTAIGKALSRVAALGGFGPMTNPQPVSKAGVYAVKAVQEGYTYNNMAAYVGFGEVNGQYPVLQSAELQAKRTEVSLDKSHNDADKVSAIGETVTYTITTYVPYIDPMADNKTYYIHDEITGAEYVLEDGNVKGTVTKETESVGAAIVPTTPEASTASGAFYIDLSSLIDDENSNAGQEIVVTYEAKVTAVDVHNTAKAGHLSTDGYGSEYGTDDEDVYTGQITLTKTGEAEDEKLENAGFEVTDEGNAVVYFTKDEAGVYSRVKTEDVPGDVKTALDTAATDKAVDKDILEQEKDGVTYVRQVFTKGDGTVLVQGLNVGTYQFTEKTAPTGYSINGEPATAELEVTGTAADGTLTATSVLKATTSMSDTRLNELPSTGGIGTTIFTIGGCAIMIIAAGLYFATRRKSAK